MNHHADTLIRHRAKRDGTADINVVLGVVGEDHRGIHLFPEYTGDDGGGCGTVGVDDIRLESRQLRNLLFGKGIARAIAAGYSGSVKALIRDDGIGIGGIIRIRVTGRAHHDGAVMIALEIAGIVHDHIGHTVDHRREGIIQKTYFHV